MRDDTNQADPAKAPKKRRSRWWTVLIVLAVVAGLLIAARAMMPRAVRWYVNRTIDQSILYTGEIGEVRIHLWRGAYSIGDVRLNKIVGNVPAPLFAAERVDFSIQWDALMEGKVVGQVLFERPELNFVDADDEEDVQTGAGGPWLQIIEDLFPFRINSAIVRDGSIHFRAIHTDPPVDVYLSRVEAEVRNLTNIHDEVAPLITTVQATALAMDQAQVEYHMKLDPFSYRPTFQMALRLLNLDVTKVNDLTMAYGSFDFHNGWFDLVIEVDAREGQMEGLVKPLFRNLQVIDLAEDLPPEDVLNFFWQALVGLASELLKNHPRDQLATVIPLSGDLDDPDTSILAIIGNVLRNAFVRAYLPRFHGVAQDVVNLQFGPGMGAEPVPIDEP